MVISIKVAVVQKASPPLDDFTYSIQQSYHVNDATLLSFASPKESNKEKGKPKYAASRTFRGSPAFRLSQRFYHPQVGCIVFGF
jgi:hypothetical protein